MGDGENAIDGKRLTVQDSTNHYGFIICVFSIFIAWYCCEWDFFL